MIVSGLFCNRNGNPYAFFCFVAFSYWNSHYLAFSDKNHVILSHTPPTYFFIKKKIMWGYARPHRICCFLFDRAQTPQFSFPAVIKSTIAQIQNIYWQTCKMNVFKRKNAFQQSSTLLTSPLNLLLASPTLTYLRCFHLLQIIITLPFKNFVLVANTPS